MTGLLVKLFIKNADKTSDPAVREKYGVLSGFTGIALNIVLFLIKFFVGLITGAISVTADAFNNLTDAGSSVVTVIGFKLSARPADEEHPFGHGRIEYLAGLIISMFIFVVGFELLTSSFDRILHPIVSDSGILLPLVLLVLSILVKLWMFVFNRTLSDKIRSAAMRATATDSLTDSVATGAVAVGLVLSYLTRFDIDGYLGCAVALFIMYSGYKTARDSLSPLLGQTPDHDTVAKIREIVGKYPEVIGMHDLVIHDYGPGRMMITLHAEVRGDSDIIQVHDTIDLLEMELKRTLKCSATIHMDPIDVKDETANALREEVIALALEIDPTLSIHDFRIVSGKTHTNLIFDVVVPYGVSMSDAEIASSLRAKIRAKHSDCFAVIQVEHSFV